MVTHLHTCNRYNNPLKYVNVLFSLMCLYYVIVHQSATVHIYNGAELKLSKKQK